MTPPASASDGAPHRFHCRRTPRRIAGARPARWRSARRRPLLCIGWFRISGLLWRDALPHSEAVLDGCHDVTAGAAGFGAAALMHSTGISGADALAADRALARGDSARARRILARALYERMLDAIVWPASFGSRPGAPPHPDGWRDRPDA